MIVTAWSGFVVAVLACGLSLYCIYAAGEHASGVLIYNYGGNYRLWTRWSYIFLDVAGGSFVGGLILTVATAYTTLKAGAVAASKINTELSPAGPQTDQQSCHVQPAAHRIDPPSRQNSRTVQRKRSV